MTIIEAMGQLKDKNIVYLICGKGELLSSLQERAKRLGIEEKVKFLGYRKDVHEIMQCVDICAFPSKREGLGLASLEAMAAGLPIVGARTRGVVDYVVDGETGYLCEVENPDAYVEAIKRLYENRQTLSVISRTCIEKVGRYDIGVIKRQVHSIMEKMINGDRR